MNARSDGSSSATSLSSLDLDTSSEKASLDEVSDRTQQELESDLARYPALEADVQAEIVRKYRLLNERIKAEGLYQCNYTAYFIEVCRYAFLSQCACSSYDGVGIALAASS